MIHEEICTYEVCKLAKEKGFREMASCYQGYRKDGTLFYFSNIPDGKERVMQTDCLAPTQSLLQRWLRKKKNIHIEIVATACGYFWIADKTNGTAITDSDVLDRGTNEGGCFDTFELCLEDALKYILQNLV